MKKRSSDEDGEYSEMGVLPIYSVTNVVKRYTVNIDDYITNPSYYRNVIHTLDHASENDLVVFHINSGGGNVMTTMQICNSIDNTEARTVAVCHGITASAATAIALRCDEIYVTPGNSWLCHQPTWGSVGKTRDVRDEVDFFTKELIKWCHNVYEGFMTQEEIEDMIESGKDILMTDDEVKNRLEQRNEYLQEKMEEEQRELEELIMNQQPAKKKVAKKKTS